MKKLFKNSFFAFFKTKLGLVLTALIILLSASTFTMMSSTSSSFNSSLNHIVEEGQMHDFTMNEKYSSTGSFDLDIQKDGAPVDIKQVDASMADQVQGNYIYFAPKGGAVTSPLVYSARGKDLSISFRAKYNDFIGSFNLTTGQILKPLEIQVLLPKKIDDYHTSIIDEITLDVIKETAPKIPDEFNTRDGEWFSSLPTSSGTKIILKHGEDLNIETIPASSGFFGHASALKIQSSDFEDFIKNTLSSHIMSGSFQNWSINSFINTKGVYSIANNKTKLPVISGDKINWTGAFPTFQELASVATVDDVKKGKAFENALDEVKLSLDKSTVHEQRLAVLSSIDKSKVIYKDVQSLIVNDGNKTYKVVNGISDVKVDKMVLNAGSLPHAPMDNVGMISNLLGNYFAAKNEDTFKPISDLNLNETTNVVTFTFDNNSHTLEYDGISSDALPSGHWKLDGEAIEMRKESGYKWVITWIKRMFGGSTAPQAASYIDPYSYQIVISPAYASVHNIKPLSPRQAFEDATSDVFNSNIEKYASDNKSSVVKVGSQVYQVVGIGTTPDFMYPIIDGQRAIPNIENEAILFTDQNGFNSFDDAYRGNAREDYLAFKFADGISVSEQNKIISELETASDKQMSIHGFHIVSRWDDKNESINLAPFRITPLFMIQKTVGTIALAVPLTLIFITAIIVLMIIRTQISNKRKQLGILLANGYSKWQIGASMASIALIVGGLSTIIGYTAGHFLQYAFTGAFSNYWTIPIAGHDWSWLAFTLTIALPIVGISLFAFIITLVEMRGTIPHILSGAESLTAQKISAKVQAPFKFFGIKTKISISLFGSNLFKMFLTTVALTMSIIASTVAFTSFGKFEQAQNDTINGNNYEFRIDMVSPTQEGGIYNSYMLSDIYQTGSDGNHSGANGAPYFHIPTSIDATEQSSLHYLEDKVQIKSFLNVPMKGFADIGTIPWSTAHALMPANQRNQADSSNISFLKEVLKRNNQDYKDDNLDVMKPVYELIASKLLINPDTLEQKVGFDSNKFISEPLDVVSGLIPVMDQEFIDLIYKTLDLIIKDIDAGDETAKELLPTFISYGNMLIDKNDEKYTHVDVKMTLKDVFNSTSEQEFSIIGINKDSKSIVRKGISQHLDNFNEPNISPLVINKFTQYKFNLHIGQTFDLASLNHKDRFNSELLKTDLPKTKYKIVGVDDSYSGKAMYTTREAANKSLGWSGTEMFNGLFTHEKNPLLLKEMNFYSYTGLYPATDKILVGDTTYSPNAYSQLSKNAPLNNFAGVTEDQFLSAFGTTPYILGFSHVDWYKMNINAFKSISELSSTVIWVVEAIILSISLLFIVLMAGMMINATKKFITTTKILGYRNNEIRVMFIKSFLIPMLLSIIIAIPISIGVLLGLQAFIVGFGEILIPLTMIGWELIVASVVVIGLFLMLFIIAEKNMQNTTLVQAFSE